MAGKLKFLLILGLIFLLCFPVSAAQDIEFRLDMDSLNLQLGVSTNLIVSIINAQNAEIYSIEGIDDFEVLSQNSSTSLNISGNVSNYQEDSYFVIMPKSTGEFTLKAIIELNGQYYETNELHVSVTESSSEDEAESDLFVKTVVSHTDAYLGEKLVVTYELYSRYSIESFGFTDYTAIDGVVAKDIPSDDLKSEYVYLGGLRYVKYEAKQLILDPVKTGTISIPAFNFQVNVITSNSTGGIFGGFFNRTQAMYLQTKPAEFNVIPLPTEGRPPDFSGIVGDLQLNGSYSRQSLNYGESLSLQATISGNCNLDSFKSLLNNKLSGFTVYETPKNTTESVSDYKYNVQKDFEAILVPEKNGSIKINPISLSYFSPSTGKYETAEISGATIEVLGDMPVYNGQAGSIDTVNITQISYGTIDDGYFVVRMEKRLLLNILIIIGILAVIAVTLVVLIVRRKNQDPELKSIYRKISAANNTSEIYNLFNAMIRHCYGISVKSYSQSDVRNSLPDPDIAACVADVMDYWESFGDKDSSDLKSKVKRVFTKITK